MNNKELAKKLKNLKTGQLDAEWASRNREIMLSQIRAQQNSRLGLFSKEGANLSWQLTKTFFPTRLAVKTVSAVVLVFILVLGTSVTTTWADRSLPGDILYSVKITTEKVQLTLTSNNKEAKARLNMEFAGKRVEEMEQLNQERDQTVEKKTKQIETTLKKYKKNIEAANDRLQEVEDAEAAVELATVIDDQTEEYSEILEAGIEQGGDKNIEEEMSDALEVSEEVNDQAVDLIIDKHASGEVSELTDEELVEKVAGKMIKAGEKVDGLNDQIAELEIAEGEILIKSDEGEGEGEETVDEAVEEEEVSEEEAVVGEEADDEAVEEEETSDEAVDVIQQSEDATAVLVEAQELLENGELSSSLEKIKESNEIIKIAEEAMDQSAEEGDSQSESAASEDQPVVKGEELEVEEVEAEAPEANLVN